VLPCNAGFGLSSLWRTSGRLSTTCVANRRRPATSTTSMVLEHRAPPLTGVEPTHGPRDTLLHRPRHFLAGKHAQEATHHPIRPGQHWRGEGVLGRFAQPTSTQCWQCFRDETAWQCAHCLREETEARLDPHEAHPNRRSNRGRSCGKQATHACIGMKPASVAYWNGIGIRSDADVYAICGQSTG
jgi:hypothetical protein